MRKQKLMMQGHGIIATRRVSVLPRLWEESKHHYQDVLKLKVSVEKDFLSDLTKVNSF